ncbi:MAG: DUF190 domain-containing protein [Actinomycetota bacterium]|nr:DUF190 domain-containing protein [Actinomycetota bacterium]
MTLPRNAERLTIYLEQTERHGRIPEFVEIVGRARRLGLAGATVVPGVEGFGGSARVHRRRGLGVKADVPVVIMIVDTSDHIDRLLFEAGHLIWGSAVVRQPVEVIVHRHGRTGPEVGDP